jgi:hypothetical protein
MTSRARTPTKLPFVFSIPFFPIMVSAAFELCFDGLGMSYGVSGSGSVWSWFDLSFE